MSEIQAPANGVTSHSNSGFICSASFQMPEHAIVYVYGINPIHYIQRTLCVSE